jgi:hypothetical protein
MIGPVGITGHRTLAEVSMSRCGRKKPYHSITLAEKVAEARSLATGTEILPYRCFECGNFHIGHRPKEGNS